MEAFRERTVSALQWSGIGQVARQGISFVIGILLMRLLSPEDFGLIAMIMVILGFATIYADLGFAAALIQKEDADDRHFSSIFWLNLAGGLLLTLLFVAGAPLIASFYDRPVLIPLTMVLATRFFVGSTNIIQRTLLVKSLDFRRLAIIDTAAVAGAGGLAVLLAAGGAGVWSLVVLKLGGVCLAALLLWRLSEWRPRFLFDLAAVRELIGFSSSLLGTETLNYWARNLDDLLIGRIFGSQPLGVYNRAYSVMLFPLENISSVFARVMFPSYSLVKDDKARVRRIHLRITRSVAVFTFPLMLGLLVTAEPFVLGIFGEQWALMVPILRILSLVGLTQSIMTLNGSLYLSQGRADLQFKVGLYLKGTMITGILVGLNWGVVGVAAGYAVAEILNAYPAFRFAGRLVGLSFVDLVRNLSGVFACALAMATAVWALGVVLPTSWSPLAALAAQVSVGVLVYGGLLLITRLEAYLDLRKLVEERLSF